MTEIDWDRCEAMCDAFATRIAPAYEALGWRWGEDIPTAETILLRLQKMLADIRKKIEGGRSWVSLRTGGLLLAVSETADDEALDDDVFYVGFTAHACVFDWSDTSEYGSYAT